MTWVLKGQGQYAVNKRLLPAVHAIQGPHDCEAEESFFSRRLLPSVASDLSLLTLNPLAKGRIFTEAH